MPPATDVPCEEDLQATPTLDRGEAEGPGPRGTLTVGGCVYVGGGNCVEHGPGAKRYWRPLPKSAGGGREYYYECDVGPRGRGRFRQARLSSYVKTTPKRK